MFEETGHDSTSGHTFSARVRINASTSSWASWLWNRRREWSGGWVRARVRRERAKEGRGGGRTSVLGPTPRPSNHTSAIHRPSDNLVLDPWQILRSPSTDENDRVLLEVVAFSGNVGVRELAGRELHSGDFPYLRESNARREQGSVTRNCVE